MYEEHDDYAQCEISHGDRRGDVRHAINLAVKAHTPIACTLTDVSKSGARLSIDDPSALPEEFLLLLRDDLRRWCRVIWRSQTQIGVAFIERPPGLIFV
ncbi:MAG TPA: PilZ domain-containing protein [Pseudolabrys sp.]|nr:PilZ domain-containing protein [Pseudolabrys sp.]